MDSATGVTPGAAEQSKEHEYGQLAGTASSPAGDAGTPDKTPAAPVGRRWRRWEVAACWALAVMAAFTLYLRLAGTRAVNSDGAAQAIQAWDILHGNVLLSGWRLSEVSFYTTDIPQDILVELVHGYSQDVVPVGAAITYTLAVLLAALLAKGKATGREAVVRVALAVGIMLAPQLDSGTNVMLSSPDHLGTALPVLLAWLILDRCGSRWFVPVLTSLLLAIAVVGDQTVLFIAVVPAVVVCAVRIARAGRKWPAQRFEMALGAGAVAAGAAGTLGLDLIRAAAGFSLKPPQTQVAPLATIIGHSLHITGESLLLLGGADFIGLPVGVRTFFVMLHIVGVALAGIAVTLAAWRFLRESDTVAQLLLVGIAVNLAVFLVGTYAVIVPDSRHILPVLPFASVLAGRQLVRPLLARRLVRRTALPALCLVLAGYCAGLATELTAPEQAAQNTQLATWLESHHLDNGLAGYWDANVVTLTTGGRVRVRSVKMEDGRIIRGVDELKSSWYDPALSTADFFVLSPGVADSPSFYPGITDRRVVIATFGEPVRSYHFGDYTILLWHKNLLKDVAP